MALFRCSTCNAEYENFYPVDDTCPKCKRGFIRIIVGLQVCPQSMWISTV
jgi:Zn finger protein HypA/HybF involved in hydrogenase expression